MRYRNIRTLDWSLRLFRLLKGNHRIINWCNYLHRLHRRHLYQHHWANCMFGVRHWSNCEHRSLSLQLLQR